MDEAMAEETCNEQSLFAAPDILIFLHIEKTAGGTFNQAIFNQLPRDQRFHASRGRTSATGLHYMEDIAEAYKKEVGRNADKLRIVSGHVPFGIHKLFSAQSKYISFVREPVDRIISSYYYFRRIDLSKEMFGERFNAMSLHEYAGSRIRADLADGQVRALSGLPALDVPVATGEELDFPDVTDDDWRQTMQNIKEHFLFVAPQEEIDHVICILAHAYGLSLEQVACLPDNVTKGRPRIAEVPQETRELIKTRNVRDAALHDFAKNSFSLFKKSLPLDVDADVWKLRELREHRR